MAENDTTSEEPLFIEEFTELIRRTAVTICAEQPDVPEPQVLSDLDSFSMVQVLLDLENELEMEVLEQLEGFEGTSFREIAEHIDGIAERNGDHEKFVAAVKRIVNDETVEAAS